MKKMADQTIRVPEGMNPMEALKILTDLQKKMDEKAVRGKAKRAAVKILIGGHKEEYLKLLKVETDILLAK